MKKQDTAAFSLIRCDTEKKMPALAVRAIRAALFFAGLLAVAQGSRRDLDKLRLALGRRGRCGAGLAERGA
ncbi:MAG: hypothetical protein ACLS3C_00110 [Oscillospiraceae bacterium]